MKHNKQNHDTVFSVDYKMVDFAVQNGLFFRRLTRRLGEMVFRFVAVLTLFCLELKRWHTTFEIPKVGVSPINVASLFPSSFFSVFGDGSMNIDFFVTVSIIA